LSQGHRRVAFINGPASNFDARERLRGYREGLLSAGGQWEPGLELNGDFSEDSGYAAAGRALALEPRPDAIFAANDGMAMGVLSALREACVGVPGQMALAGFDDIPMVRYLTPPLSSVHVPIAEMGQRAAERLLSAAVSGTAHERRHETLPTTVVVRESCGAGASRPRRGARRAV